MIVPLVALTLASYTWQRRPAPRDPIRPSPRIEAAIGYDVRRQRLYVFGGRTIEGNPLDDTWVFDFRENRWTRPESANDARPHPSPRSSMFYGMDQPLNQARDAFVIAMGRSYRDEALDDVWSFDLNYEQWHMLMPSGRAPSPRYAGASGIDPTHREDLSRTNNFLIVSHGRNANQAFDDTFVLELAGDLFSSTMTGHWSQVDASGPPTPRHSMASTVARNHRLVMHGGCVGADEHDCFSNRGYELFVDVIAKRGVWGEIKSELCPGGHVFGKLISAPNADDDEMVLISGRSSLAHGSIGILKQRIWMNTLPEYANATESDQPPHLYGSSIAVNTGTVEVASTVYVVFGATEDGQVSNEMWELVRDPLQVDMTEAPCPLPARTDVVDGEDPMQQSRGMHSMLLLHGLMTAIPFLFLIPIALFTKRYSKDSTRLLYAHSILLVMTTLLVLVGVVFGFVLVQNFGTGHMNQFHHWIGLLVSIGLFLLILSAFFQPKEQLEEAERNSTTTKHVTLPQDPWNKGHRIVGYITFFGGIIAVGVGLGDGRVNRSILNAFLIYFSLVGFVLLMYDLVYGGLSRLWRGEKRIPLRSVHESILHTTPSLAVPPNRASYADSFRHRQNSFSSRYSESESSIADMMRSLRGELYVRNEL